MRMLMKVRGQLSLVVLSAPFFGGAESFSLHVSFMLYTLEYQGDSRQFFCLFLLANQELLKLQIHASIFGFSRGFQRLNPSHEACKGRALPTVPSYQPPLVNEA